MEKRASGRGAAAEGGEEEGSEALALSAAAVFAAMAACCCSSKKITGSFSLLEASSLAAFWRSSSDSIDADAGTTSKTAASLSPRNGVTTGEDNAASSSVEGA